jgi:uncharacterized membrane protein YsdA (DUF1294 family)
MTISKKTLNKKTLTLYLQDRKSKKKKEWEIPEIWA